MKKARIIKREYPDGSTRYVIQQKHFLFRWWWVDAWVNCGVDVTDSFGTLEEAENKLIWFDGTNVKETVLK